VCAMIELKTPQGRLSKAQKDWEDWGQEFGLPYAVCRSLEEVIDVLRAWNVPLRLRGGEVRSTEQGSKEIVGVA